MYRGKLKNWNDDNGYGFITTPELKDDTFIHVSTLKHMSRKPKEGDYIYFDIEQRNGKSNATNARIEGVNSQQTTCNPKKSLAFILKSYFSNIHHHFSVIRF